MSAGCSKTDVSIRSLLSVHDKENVLIPFGGDCLTSTSSLWARRSLVPQSSTTSTPSSATRRSTPSIFGSVALLAETACPTPKVSVLPPAFPSPYHFQPIVTAPTGSSPAMTSSYPWMTDMPKDLTSTPVSSLLRHQQVNQSAMYRSSSVMSTSVGSPSASPLIAVNSPCSSPQMSMTSVAQPSSSKSVVEVKVCTFVCHS